MSGSNPPVVAPMGAPRGATTEPAPPLDPVIFEGTDPVLLVRVEGNKDTTTVEDMAAAAMAAGEAAKTAGAELQASQQEPVAGSPDAPPPPDPAPIAPPINTAVPHVSQTGSNLNCTMGTWTGVPTSYAYQWQIDGANVGSNAADYAVQSGDVGKTGTCVVTATNAQGSTAAPPSNGVIIA